ncbi:MAG: hypothetical protein R3336_02920 [Phycisphaeraceae bacterium]|nr:hypothetical protein [Phycisphaeraceae bacterium]
MASSDPDRLLILCALADEAARIECLDLPGHVTVTTSGVGADRIVRAFMSTLDGAPRPDRVLLAGVGGALDPDLERGDLVVVNSVVGPDDAGWQLSPDQPPKPRTDSSEPPDLLSVDQPINSVAAKAKAYQQTHARTVDLEGLAMARACATEKIPLQIVRGISDSARDTLPAECTHWVDADGRTRVGAVLRSLLIRPWRLPTLFRLAGGFRRGMDAVVSHIDRTNF